MPYLTPSSVPAELTARTLFIPNSTDWLSLVRGALLELAEPGNWEQSAGGIAVDDAVQAALQMLETLTLGGDEMKVGSIILGAWATTPDNLLLCDGGAYNQAAYPELVAVLHANFLDKPFAGAFQVPDMRNRVPVGSSNTKAMGATGGSETHTLTLAEMPAHDHNLTLYSAGATVNTSRIGSGATGGAAAVATVTAGPMADAGSGEAHSIMQPWLGLNFYLVAKP